MSAAAPLLTSTQQSEDLLASVLVQLVIMIGAARGMNLVFRRLGQPGVVGEIVAGLLLGPSLFGHFFPGISHALFGAKPAAPIVVLSQIGLLLLMFQVGMNFEFGQLRQARAKAGLLPITAASVLVPFACGIGLGHLSAPVFAGAIPVNIYALFCGVALAITAVPILGRILAEYGMADHELGVLTVSAAALNDVIGWLLLATVSALATATFTPAKTVEQVAGVLGFALLCWFALRPAAAALLRAFPVKDNELPSTLLAITLASVLVMGLCTYKLGIFTIFGGFTAGLLVHQDRAFVEAWRRQVGAFVLVFFLPIFFTSTGLRTNILGLTTATDWIWLLAFAATGTLAKIIPVYVTGRLVGYNSVSALLLGVLMNTRALMELIVLNIGLETGYLPAKIFTMLVIVAVLTTLTPGPFLKWLLPRMGVVKPEFVEA